MSYQHPSWREEEDTRHVIAQCSYCGRDIHAEDENNYGDDAYSYDGNWCCEEYSCQQEFLKLFKIGG